MEHERLYIFTLGGLLLTHKGEPVAALVSKKAEALLVYLACEGRTISREILAELLWEERGQRQAMSNLRVVLASLRKELGEFITITRDTTAVNRDAHIWLDVDQFEGLLSSGNLEKAVEIYRGDFLEGFYLRDAREFEGWIVIQRERLKRMYLDSLESLVDTALETGDHHGGIGFASQLLSHDPTRETAHRKLMRLLAYNGQRGAALEQYQECWRVLGEEQGLEPAQETRQLYQDILDEKIIIPEPGGTLVPALIKPEFLEKDAHDRKPPPLFVAKERQLGQLNDFFQTALEGEGGVVFVCGGPGRGKTALFKEFARQAMLDNPDLLVAKGNCNAYSGIGDAYLPFREIMGMLGGDVELLWKTGRITTEHARRLWNGMPELARALLHRGPDLFETFISGVALLERVSAAEPGDSELHEELRESLARDRIQSEQMGQTHLFEQFTNVLCRLSEKCPLLLLLDDLQWVDNATISLLFHLGRRLVGSRILILGAYRAEEVTLLRDGKRHPLEQALAEFKRLYGDVWVDLSKVEGEESTRFVEALLDSEPNKLGGDFRCALLKHTDGHPLYTIELLRSMQEGGDLVRDDAGVWVVGPEIDWENLPARVEAVIGERIARLEPRLSRILKTACVEGENFSVQVVAGILDLPERAVMQMLSTELENRHRLVTEQAGLAVDHKVLSRYRFAHNLIQQYLYNGIGKGERNLLHGEIANLLVQLVGADSEELSGSIVLQLGWHFCQAGENEKAVEYLIKGGEQAFESEAYEDANLVYRQALDVLGEKDTERHAFLLYKLGVINVKLADYSQGERYLREAISLARAIGDSKIEIKSLHSLCFASRVQGSYDQAMKFARKSLELSEDCGFLAGKMRSLKLMGVMLSLSGGNFEREQECYEVSLAIAREINDEIEESACLNNLGILARLRGDISQAEQFTLQALDLAEKNNQKFRMALYMDNLGSIIWRRGRREEALELLNGSLSLAQQIGNFWEMSSILFELGWISFYWGKYEEAIQHINKGLKIARERNLRRQISIHLNILGITALENGNFERARDHFDKAYDNLIEINNKDTIGWSICGLGRLDCAQGNFTEAIKKYRKCIRLAKDYHDSLLHAYVLLSLGRVSWKMGNNQESQKHLQDGLKMFTSQDDRGDMAECYAYLGHNAVSLGEFNSARGYYRHALEISGEIGMMPVIAEALGGIAVLLSQMGEPLKAVNLTAFVNGQKECSYATRERARNLLEDFSQVMVPDEFEGAKNDGKSMGLEEALKIIEPALIA